MACLDHEFFWMSMNIRILVSLPFTMEYQILPKEYRMSSHQFLSLLCAGLIFGPLVLQHWSWLMVMHHFQNILQ